MTAPPRTFGSDRAETDAGGSRLLFCGVAKGWLPRKPGTQTSAEHPGSAVRWEAEIFEVVEVAASADGAVRYRLEPWDSRHAIRTLSHYDEVNEQARQSEQARRRASIHWRRLSLLFAPILGHLPGAVQTRMESEFGAPARFMTIASALPLFLLGVLGLLAWQLAGFGGGNVFPSWLTEHPFLFMYLFGESGLRLASAFIQGEPMGSLIGILGYEIAGALRERPARPQAPAMPEAPRQSPQRSWEAADLYKLSEPLLALLPPSEQLDLERRFQFNFRRWGRLSAVALLGIGGANLMIAFGQLAQARESFWDYFWMLAGTYLVIEQVMRWRRLAAGSPAGSVLGALVRPLTKRLFRV
jgi:hypothetical protein